MVWTPSPDTAARLVELDERKRIETAILRAGGCTIDQYEAVMRGIANEMAGYAAPPPPPDPERYKGIADVWDELTLGARNAFMREIVEVVRIGPKRLEVTFRDLGWTDWPRAAVMSRRTSLVSVLY